MKILELKHEFYQIGNSLDGSNSRMEKIEKRVGEDISIEIIQSEEKKEKDFKKTNSNLRICGTISKGLTQM